MASQKGPLPRLPEPTFMSGQTPTEVAFSGETKLDFEFDAPQWKHTSLTLQCCTTRSKPLAKAESPKGPVWETANLTWWDFQRRRWHTLWLSRTMYNRHKKTLADTANMAPEKSQPIWDEVHKQTAREMREHAENAKGLFIKAGQVMSAMPGLLPDAYVQELLSLTDHLPVSTIAEVFKLIRNDLHYPPREIFLEFDSEPIASASIAQVHRAVLRRTGEVVAVKVQHDGVDRVFLEDVGTLQSLAAQVAKWYPDLDLRKFAEEWSESLPRELDFHHERRALKRAGDVLRRAGNQCIVPRVYPDLYGRHVFVMEFIESVPILELANREFCSENGVDKHKVLGTLLDAFGIMAFKDGMFHADPHAGNVRLVLDKEAPGGAKPVLLDWGLFREIDEHERLGLAKVFHSLANFDIAGLFDVLTQLGFKTKADLMTDDFRRELLEKARGLMKDTVNRETTRAICLQDFQDWKDRLQSAEDTGNAAKGSASPVYFLEDWPRCILFFMRMMQILRGLCVSVDAEGMPILQIFVRHAREALTEGSKQDALATTVPMFAGREAREDHSAVAADSSQTVEFSPDTSMIQRVQKKLEELRAKKHIVGAQVAVFQRDRLLCDAVEGTLSSIDARPVESSTRFPLMGAAAGLAHLAAVRALLHRVKAGGEAAERERASPLQTPVVQLWPEFAGGSSELTVGDLLSHRAGLQDAFPPDFTPKMLDDVGSVAQHLESSDLPKAKEARYAYLMQTFALTKLGECLSGHDTLLHWLGAELGPLGLDIAAPAGRGGEAAICRDLPELSRVSLTEIQEGRQRRKQQQDASPSSTESPTKRPSAPASRTLLGAIMRDPLVFDPLQGNAGEGAKFRGGLSLGVSARSLAALFSSKELREELNAVGALEPGATDPSAIGWLLTGGGCTWTSGGLQTLQLNGRGRRALFKRRQRGFGVVCGFGPCVAHFPDLARGGVTVAVTVNDVLHGRAAAAELMREVLASFGYAPSWPSVPVSVMIDATRLARSKEAEPLLKSFGGMGALQEKLAMASAASEASSGGFSGRCCSCTSGLRSNPSGSAQEGPSRWRSAWQRIATLCSPSRAPPKEDSHSTAEAGGGGAERPAGPSSE